MASASVTEAMNSSFILSEIIDFEQDAPRRDGEAMISLETYVLFQSIAQPFNLFLAAVGIITNSINIRVFAEQGVKHSNTNLGLLALSTFDLLGSTLVIVPLSCQTFTYTRQLSKLISCQPYANYVAFLTFVFNYCSHWTTVYISLERSLCVVIPLKVKLFLRPKTTAITIIGIFVFFFGVQMTYSSSTSIVWRYYPNFNATLPYFEETAFAKKYLYIYNVLANTTLNSLAICIVAINTSIMVYKLNQFKKWRNKNVNTSGQKRSGEETVPCNTETQKQEGSLSTKDVELMKSVTTVTCIFLVCLSMGHIPATTILLLPGMSLTGLNRYFMFLTYAIRTTFALINSSVNFFFYIRVSSRYREAFHVVFNFKRCSQGDEKTA